MTKAGFLVSLTAALALVLGGCGSESGGQWSVDVTGSFGAPVSVQITGKPHLQGMRATTLSAGEGVTIQESSPVLFRATSFDSRTGNQVNEYDTGRVRLQHATTDELGDLAQYVIGQKEGSRLLLERGGLVQGDNNTVEIVVIDLFYTNARGNPVPTPEPPPAGMPGINTAEDAGPVITSGGGPISKLAIVPLVAGTGTQVGEDDAVIAQYVLANTEGEILDSTWAGPGPQTLHVQEVMTGLRTAIQDQKIGSRIAVLIPEEQAHGEGDLVAIVDLLAIREP